MLNNSINQNLNSPIFLKLNRFFNKGKRSLPTKIVDDDEEITKRLLSLPKWKLLYKDYSQMCKFTGNVKSPLKKSIFATKTAVLIPLSPLQIYKVHIYPTTFVFGMVSNPKFNIETHKIDQMF